MEIRLRIVGPGTRLPEDVVVAAAPGSTAGDLAACLDLPADTLHVDGRRIPPATLLGMPPLLDGAVVRVDGPGSSTTTSVVAALELHVGTGPDCGQVLALPPGRHRLGRAAGAGLRVLDPDVSRVHLDLTVSQHGIHVDDLGTTNGTLVDGLPVGPAGALVAPGSVLTAGSSTLTVRHTDRPPAAGHEDGLGHILVNRAPRLDAPVPETQIRLPRRPGPVERRRLPLVAVLAPLAVAGLVAAVLRSPVMLLFALTGPVMMLAGQVGDRRSGRSSSTQAWARYADAEADARRQVATALDAEASLRRCALPDHAELLGTVSLPGRRLWERRRADADFLSLRVGRGPLPARLSVLDPDREPATGHPDLPDVPVAFSLAEAGVVGLTGPRHRVCGLARALVGQLCAWHSPLDLRLVILAADEERGAEWAWAAYLPHTRADRDDGCRNRVGIMAPGSDQVQRRVAELTALLERRRGESPGAATRHGASGGGVGSRWAGACTVVLLDGAQSLRAVPGVALLLQDGPALGIHTICLDSDPSRLPVETRATLRLGDDRTPTLRVSLSGAAPVPPVVPDLVSARWAQRVAHALAPLRDATPASGDLPLPDDVRLLDILGFDGTDPAQVSSRWQSRPSRPAALLGLGVRGPHTVDLRRDGPHALVGGTTGSGKSELLQTIVASLALNNRPDRLSFVLVDYKGGSAFRECARLPHTVGLVTDLDPHLTERALASLDAELKRRERLLASREAKDIDDYAALASPTDAPLPRLVLVIDEFRMLAEELPDFLSGLVRVAAVGRSLGIHLLLATQRPSGIVSADIKANVNLRIALRLRDAVDSVDVIDSDAAATILEGTPGRACLRSGANALVTFQTARVGGHRHDQPAAAVTVRPLPWREVGDAVPAPGEPAAGGAHSDLARIVRAARAAAADLRVPPAPVPWLLALPATVALEGLEPAGPWKIPYARLDLPALQAQRTLCWDLAGGHLTIAGAARTGRSRALETIAASIARCCSPADVHLHVIDAAAGALGCLSALPHTGVVAGGDDLSRVVRLVERLREEVARRHELLSRHGFGSVTEQRAAAGSGPREERPLPWLVLLVDGWGALCAALERVDRGAPVEVLLRLLREGRRAGLCVALTGDRSALLSRVASTVTDTLVLRMDDPTDLALAGIPSVAVPTPQPPGRAVRAQDGAEVQIASLAVDVTGPARIAALQALGRTCRARHAGLDRQTQAWRIAPLPQRVTYERARHEMGDAAPGSLLLGVGGDELDAVTVDVHEPGWSLLVAGPARSGRSTSLVSIARQLMDLPRPLVLVAPRRSPLREEASRPGVLRLLGPGDAADLHALHAAHPQLVVVVDDAELLLDTPVESVLLALLREDEHAVTIVCAAASTELSAMFRGLAVQLRKRQTGILLCPTSRADGDLFDVRVGGDGERLPGRGLWVRHGRVTPMQMALPPQR